jgi:hypothetical protein
MKSSRHLITVATWAFLFALVVATATAGTSGNGWSQSQRPDLRYLVTSVDATTGTVQVEFMRDKTTQTYKIDANTRIKVGDYMGTFDQIKVGMQFRKYAVREGQTLAALVVDKADPAPVQPPPPKNSTPGTAQ